MHPPSVSQFVLLNCTNFGKRCALFLVPTRDDAVGMATALLTAALLALPSPHQHPLQAPAVDTAAPPSCSTRTLNGGEIPRGGYTERDGMVWSNHRNYQNCSHAQHITGYCGEPQPVDLTVCVQRGGGNVTTKEMIVGPITTTGGNDWTAIHYWELVDGEHEGSPHPLGIRGFYIALLEGSPQGPELGFPPLHDHHTTIELNEPTNGTFRAKGWLEQQADSQCPNEADGFECHAHNLRALGSQIPTGTDWGIRAFSLFNDVRPEDSPPLTWYFKTTIELEPLERDSELLQQGQYMIQHFYINGTQDNTIDVPIGRESFYLSQSSFLSSGQIVPSNHYTHVHTHAQQYQASYLVAASIAEMGLDQARFASRDACTVAETAAQSGFANNREMMAWLESELPEYFSLDAPNTKLLCRANAGTARVGQYDYDRRNSLECSGRPFVRGEVYTSVGFFGGHAGHTTPPMPMAPTVNYPMHMNWQISFTLPARANLSDTPLFVSDVTRMMSQGPDGQMYYTAQSIYDASVTRWLNMTSIRGNCEGYLVGGL